MSAVGGPQSASATPPPDPKVQLRKLADQLEGVFLNQLFQAMRASVPKDGVLGSAPGQEMFDQMFDEKMANEASRRMEHGLGEALYRQLEKRLPGASTTEAR